MSLSDLNPDQLVAAECLRGRVLVTAGAGSGKTRLLVGRFAHAVESGASDVDSLATITFTEKAAAELGERVRARFRQHGKPELARRTDAAWISTIHGLCSRILREHALEAGLDPLFRILPSEEAAALKLEAVETVLERALEDSDDVKRLVSTYRFETLAAVVERISRELRGRGLDSRSIHAETARSIDRVVDDAVRSVIGLLEGLKCFDAGAAGVVDANARLSALLEALSAVGRTQTDSPDASLETVRILAGFKKGRKTAGMSVEMRADIADTVERLIRDAAAAYSAPLARALARLVDERDTEYARLKQRVGALDFDDLPIEVARLLRTNPGVAESYRAAFDLVMVDEFQDTDQLQLEIVEALAGGELCSVGDARQSIYGFRGADLRVYRRHIDQMCHSGARCVRLDTNYRSHAEILAFVNGVFGSPSLFGSELMPLRAASMPADADNVSSGPRIDVSILTTSGSKRTNLPAEADAVASRLRTLRDQHGVPERDMVILVRSYKAAPVFAAALARQGLHPLVVGGSRFWGMPEVGAVRALARVISNPRDESALACVLAWDALGLSDSALYRLRAKADAAAASSGLWERLQANAAELEPGDARRAAKLIDVVERAAVMCGSEPLRDVLLLAIEMLDVDLVMLSQGRRGQEALANLMKLLRMADEFEARDGGGLPAFERWLSTKETHQSSETPAAVVDETADAVRIMSIHASKGLEFPVVAVVDTGRRDPSDSSGMRVQWTDGTVGVALGIPRALVPGCARTIPTPRYAELDRALKQAEAEERARLFYVACTRARDVLLISGSGTPKPVEHADATMLSMLRVGLGLEDAIDAGDTFVVELRDDVNPAVARVSVTIAESDEPRDAEATEEEAPRQWDVLQPATPPACDSGDADAPEPPPSRLSYSSLHEYETCGRRFYVERVLGVRARQSRAVSPAQAFGSAVHHALEQAVTDGALPDRERLGKIAAQFAVPEDGLEELAVAVERLWAASPVRAALDAAFVRAEAPFNIRVGADRDGFYLGGSMDVYARHGDGRALIVDYKSGVDARESLAEKYALQARCYALAAFKDGASSACVTFIRPEVLEAGAPQQQAFEFDAPDAIAIESSLLQTWNRMSVGAYPPMSVVDRSVCGDCAVPGGWCEGRIGV